VFTGRHRNSTTQRGHIRRARTRAGARRVTRSLAATLVAGVVAGVMVITAHPAWGQTVAAATAVTTQALPAAGAYGYTLDPDSSADIKAAINETVSPMIFITRGIARSRLTKINPLPERMRVQLGADTVSVAFDDDPPVTAPLDGTVVSWLNPLSKETDHVHLAVAGDTLRQTFVADDGVRENALIFTSDGSRVVLRVTVTSHRLPKPLTYELLFRGAKQQ
jgi:hypothetical protein